MVLCCSYYNFGRGNYKPFCWIVLGGIMNNWFDNETLANEWYDDMVRRISWKAFEDQESWIYMLGELGEGRNPKVKDNFLEKFSEYFDAEISWLKWDMIYNMLADYYNEDIDVPQWLADEYNDYFGLKKDNRGYMEGTDD